MGELSFWGRFRAWIDEYWPCKLLWHRYKFEPMEGDKPPFEFDHCCVCGNANPTFDKNGSNT